MLQREQVSGLICDELIQVDEAVEEDSDLGPDILQLLETKVAVIRRLDHIVHLAQ